MASLSLDDLEPQFSIKSPKTECEKNGDYYDSNGNIIGKMCPLSGLLIQKSGERLTSHTLLDSSDSIKMSDGYCYNKRAFITYLKTNLVKGIDKIKSPMTNVAYPEDEIQEFHNSGLVNFDSIIEYANGLSMLNETCFYQFVSPTFYYSFNNTFNNVNAQNLLFLHHVNQHVSTLGTTNNLDYVKYLIQQNYTYLFENRFNPEYGRIYTRIIATNGMFKPFVNFDGGGFIWENHPFFNSEARKIIERVSDASMLPNTYSGIMSLRSGKQIVWSEKLHIHDNKNVDIQRKWNILMDRYMEPLPRGGKRSKRSKRRKLNKKLNFSRRTTIK